MVETERVSSHNAVGHRVMEDSKRLEGEGEEIGMDCCTTSSPPPATGIWIPHWAFGQAEKRVHVLSSHLRARSMMCCGRQLVEIALEDVLPGCIGTSMNGVNDYSAWGFVGHLRHLPPYPTHHPAPPASTPHSRGSSGLGCLT